MKPNNCFLAMFDVIGFKALSDELGTDGLYKMYKRGIQPMIEHSAAGKGKTITRGDKKVHVPDFSEISVNYKIISDSIILYTNDDSFDSFIDIINSSSKLLQSGFAGLKAPYRGAIAHGDLIDDHQGTYIGSAVEDAYIGESSQVWAGCMLTKTCSEFVVSNDYINKYETTLLAYHLVETDEKKKESLLLETNRITKYDTPMQRNPKTGPIEYFLESHYVLDWTLNMYQDASSMSFKYSDNSHAKLIKENTVIFEKWARENNRKTSP